MLSLNRGDFMQTALVLGTLSGVAFWQLSGNPSLSAFGFYAAIGSGALITVGTLLTDLANGYWMAIPTLTSVGVGILILNRATTVWAQRAAQALMFSGIIAPLVWWAAKAFL